MLQSVLLFPETILSTIDQKPSSLSHYLKADWSQCDLWTKKKKGGGRTESPHHLRAAQVHGRGKKTEKKKEKLGFSNFNQMAGRIRGGGETKGATK